MGRLYLGALALALSTWTVPAAEVTEAGKALDNVLGGMHVKKLWIFDHDVIVR